MHTVHRTARRGLSAQGQKLVYHLCGLRICGQRGQRDGHYRTPPPAAAKRLLTNRFRFAILKNSSYAAVFTRIQALCARALEILRPWAGAAHMAAFYSFARQSYKKNSCGLFFGCAARPRARPSRSFFIGSNKKNRTDGRWKDAHLTCFLYVHKSAARRFRARLWFGAPSTKRENAFRSGSFRV